MKWAIRILGVLLALGVTVGIVGALSALYVLHSPQGLEWAYRLAVSRLPGEFTVEQMRGRLSGPFTLEGLHYHNQGTEITIDRLTMQWRLSDLLGRRLMIRNLEASGIKIATAPSNRGGKARLPDIVVPLKATIAHARFRDIDYNTLHLDDIGLTGASFDHDRLEVKQLAVKAPSFEATAAGHVSPQGDYPLDATVEWSMQNAQLGTLHGTTHLSGNLDDLKVEQQLVAPSTGEAQAQPGDVPGRAFQPQTARPHRSLEGVIHGNRKVQEGRRSSGAEPAHSGSYRKASLNIGDLQRKLRESGIRLTLHGSIRNLRNAPQVELSGTWQGLHWPLSGTPIVRSDKGTFTLTGTLAHYQVHAEGDLSGRQLPPARWTLDGKGTRKTLQVSDFALQTLGGSIKTEGEVTWQPQVQWKLYMHGSGIDPGGRWPQWPGHLNFTADSHGTVRQGKVTLQATLSSLAGQLRSFPVQGTGRLTVEGQHYGISGLQLIVSDNRLTAGGTLDDDWNLHWRLDAPALGKLVDGGGGQLHGSGTVRGPRTRPLIMADLSAKQLRYAAYRAGRATLRLNVDLSDRATSHIDLTANDLGVGARTLSRARLQGTGRLRDHHIQLTAEAPNARLALAAKGAYAKAVWRATLTELTTSTTLLGEWRLASPVAIEASPSALRTGSVCLHRDRSRVCAQGRWGKAQGWQAQASLRAIPLGLFKPWLPADVNLVGSVAADATAGAVPGAIITATAQARVSAALLPAGMTARQAGFSYYPTTLDLTLDRQGFALRLDSQLAGSGRLAGTLALARPALPAPLGHGEAKLAHSLSGRLEGHVNNLLLLPAFVPGVEHTQGTVTVSVTVDGSPADPQIRGDLRLENGSAVIPALGINPDDIRIAVHGDPQGRLHLDASLHTRGGTLRAIGNLRYDPRRGLILDVHISGDKVQVMNTPEYHVMASPNLQIAVTGRRIKVNGEVVIPQADLRPSDLSGAVSPSDDVVIVSDQGASGAAESPWQISAQIRLTLGNFVKFNGFGLRGLVSGALTLSDAPQRTTTARGELSIKDGVYKAYGQKLTIDRGQLLFFGGDVGNPGLDIRAVRVVQDVTAGITVRGTLKSPQVRIFSEPAMSEADALSYLVVGRPINQISTSQGQQLYGAALSLGLAGSGLLANQIGQRFGIDELTVESGGSFGNGALVIRHYLSPRLYISYGVGLVERLNVFSIRYQISQLWSLDAESGAQSGADLLYTLERE